MLSLAMGATLILAGLALVQVVSGVLFASLFYRQPRPTDETMTAEITWPKVTILLALRGADSELSEGLRRLIQQDYPDFEIQIVVDSFDDPAREVVQNTISDHGADHVHLQILKQRSRTCGLQCSALVQAVGDSADDSEVMVTIDGDVMTHPTWLRELVQPLRDDESIGVTHGNRWFVPWDASWGSLVRCLWNAAAVVPMYLFGIPWGGTFAIRKSVLLESGLLEKWGRAIVHDAPAKSLLNKMKLRVRFVPSLMIVLPERCDLAFSLDFLKRQMTWTRIYHPNWGPVFLHTVATTAIQLLAMGLALVGAASRRWDVAAWAGFGWLGYMLVMLVLLGIMEISVRKSFHDRGERVGWMPVASMLKLPFAILLTQLIHFVAVILATFRRRVTWRGVTYEIRGPWDVSILDDQPVEQSSETGVSL